jgi:hypothetical protein
VKKKVLSHFCLTSHPPEGRNEISVQDEEDYDEIG